MEFKRTVFNIDIYGEKFVVKKLNATGLIEYQKELEACKKDSDSMGATLKMLSQQGIKEDIVQAMEIDHLNKLVSAVCGTEEGK